MKNIFISILLCALFLLLGFSQTAQAATTWVVTKTADTNDGVCDADCSLREAIAVSQNGDTINFSSIFDTPQTIDITSLGQLNINKSIQINGPTNKVLITKNSSVTGRIFFINPGGTAYVGLFNLKISNGNVTSTGGGLDIYNGDISIVNCEIYGNKAVVGGGIDSIGSILHLTNSSLRNNSAVSTNQDLGYGGGIDADSVSIRNSTISGNTASRRGGGIYTRSYLSLLNSTISDNTAFNSNCAPPTYCFGGGIAQVDYSDHPVLVIRNSTIASNNSQDGGGIWSDSTGAKQITNSIIADNTTTYAYPDVYGSDYSSVSSLIGKVDFATGFTNGIDGNIVGTTAAPVNPMLGPLQNNGGQTFTRALLPGSPAINAGSNANAVDHENGNAPLTVDQRGRPRISTDNSSNSIVDIGAFEKQFGGADTYGELRIRGQANPPRTAPFNFTTSNLNSAAFSLVDNSSSSDPYQSFFITSGTPRQTYTITESDNSTYQLSNISCTYVTPGFVPAPDFTRVGNSINITMVYPNYVDCTFVNNQIVTAANVSIGGRVLTAQGRGISNARISVTDERGKTRTVLSNPFGYYRFEELSAGQTYILQVQSKRYQFANPTQIISVNEELSNVNFTALL